MAGSSFSFNYTSAGLTFLNSVTLYETLPKAQFRPWFASGPSWPINGSELGVQLLICDGLIDDNKLRIRKRDASSCGSIISLISGLIRLQKARGRPIECRTMVGPSQRRGQV